MRPCAHAPMRELAYPTRTGSTVVKLPWRKPRTLPRQRSLRRGHRPETHDACAYGGQHANLVALKGIQLDSMHAHMDSMSKGRIKLHSRVFN